MAALKALGVLLSDAIDNKETCPFGLKGYHAPEAIDMKQYLNEELPKKLIETHIIHTLKWSKENLVSVDEALCAQTNLSE